VDFLEGGHFGPPLNTDRTGKSSNGTDAKNKSAKEKVGSHLKGIKIIICLALERVRILYARAYFVDFKEIFTIVFHN